MKSIKLPLYIGSLYFVLVAIVHGVGVKVPGLYIYFNIPSYNYQDQVISLLTFGWSVFFFSTAKSPSILLVKSILLIGLVAILILLYINLSTDFTILTKDFNLTIFHIEVGLLVIYWLWLFWGYLKFNKEKNL